PADTHPPLARRLQALRARPRAGAAGAPAAAMLGDLEERLERRLDAAWRDAVRAQWRARYDAAAADRGRLAELEALAAPTAAELAEHARLAARVRRDVDPLPLCERARSASPEHGRSLRRAGLRKPRDGQADAAAARRQRAVALDRRAARAALEDLGALALDPDLAAEGAARASALRDAFAALADPA